MNKFGVRTFLSVIGLIAAVIIIVVISETCSSPSVTHVDGRYIPAKTQAGSNICNEGIDVELLCIEFLIYDGIDDDAKKLISSGIEAIASKYKFTEPELTVDWAGFGSEGGLNNYLGVLAWHRTLSNKDDVISDLCQFLSVSKEYRDGCVDGIEEAVLSDSRWEEGMLGQYLMSDANDNGHLIILNEATFDPSIGGYQVDLEVNDPRVTMAHEYFHLYQKVHTLNMLKASDNELPTEGPYWLSEGTAEYGAVLTASAEGWAGWDFETWRIVNTIKNVMDEYPDISLSNAITYGDYKLLQSHEVIDAVVIDDNFGILNAILYDLGFLAVAYAISLSSHDALMVDYYDDLEEHGAKESFRRNVGMTFDDFHKDFLNLIQKDPLEILAVINPNFASDPTSSYKHFQGMLRGFQYTKKPSITKGVLSFTGKFPDGYGVDEIWIFYDDLPRSALEEVSAKHSFCMQTWFAIPECDQSPLVGMVIPKPEKEYPHNMPVLRYSNFFEISDTWETTMISGDKVLTVSVDIEDKMYGNGIYTIVPLSGSAMLGFIESTELIEKVGVLSPNTTAEEYNEWVDSLDKWMDGLEMFLEPLDAYSIWVD